MTKNDVFCNIVDDNLILYIAECVIVGTSAGLGLPWSSYLYSVQVVRRYRAVTNR